MAFDLEGARKEGYSDAEIADALAARAKFDVAGAREAGHSDKDIIARLKDSPKLAEASPGVAGTLADVAKQAPSGLIEGAVGVPELGAQTIFSVAKALSTLGDYLPAGVVNEAKRAVGAAKALRDIAGDKPKGLSELPARIPEMLPDPKTPEGSITRAATGAVPAAAALGVPNAIRSGLAAGAAAEGTGQALEGSPFQGVAQLAAGAAAGGLASTARAPKPAPASPAAAAAPSAIWQMAKDYAGPAAMDAVMMSMGVPGPLMSAARYAVRSARKPEAAEVPAPAAAAERPAPAPEVTPEAAPTTPVVAPEAPPAMPRPPLGPAGQFAKANGIADPAVAQINAQSLLERLARSQKPPEPAAPPPEAPVDLGQYQNVLDQGGKLEGGIADLVKQMAAPQKLLSQRSPVQYMGAPEPQLALPPPTAANRPTSPGAMPQLPEATQPLALPAPARPPVEAPVAPPAPLKVTRQGPKDLSQYASDRVFDGVRSISAQRAAVRKPAERAPRAPLAEAMKPAADDPFAIPDFLDRAKPVLAKATEAVTPPLAKVTKAAEAAKPAPKQKAKQVAEDAAEDWVIEHDKAELAPYEAANAIADKMEKDGKTFRIGRQNLVGYVSRILKDKSAAASKLSEATGIDELKLRKTLWGLKDRGAALAKIDQLVRINPTHEDLIRSTLEPKVTKWWRQ